MRWVPFPKGKLDLNSTQPLAFIVMSSTESPLDLLKIILEHLREPDLLDSHPWQKSVFLQEYVRAHPEAEQQTPGVQLTLALADLFRQFQPASPPRRKKRLDTRWGEFGILAAQYFVPFLYKRAYPRSLRDAWDQIDLSILLMTFGPGVELTDDRRETYRLVGDEYNLAPTSTISDWHRNGLERFANFVNERENNLLARLAPGQPEALTPPSPVKKGTAPFWLRLILWGLLGVILAGMLWGTFKAYRVYGILQQILGSVRVIQQFQPNLNDPEQISRLSQTVGDLKSNLNALNSEVRPYVGLAKSFYWIPNYGGDLVNAEPLLDFAISLTDSAESALAGVAPLASSISAEKVQSTRVISEIVQAQPYFRQALDSLEKAHSVRQQIDTSLLSPQIKNLLESKFDSNYEAARQVLLASLAFPDLAGAGARGQQTYLVLLQNEDELRPTGGFLTAVGTIVLKDGQVLQKNFEDSYAVDDLTEIYPPAPWQLSQYMESEILLLRDLNWYVNFPKVAIWAEYLYAYTRAPSVDGTIAIDQYALVQVLKVLGPITVPDVPEPVSADNVIQYMRKSKAPPPGVDRKEWDRKAFIQRLANPVFEKILQGDGFSWKKLTETLVRLLNEKHILLNSKNQSAQQLLERQGWGGEVVPGDGDYLMLIDTNVGFNKANAVVDRSFSYSVDLSDLKTPMADLKISYKNKAKSYSCDRVNANTVEKTETYYSIDRCYFNYLRIYSVAGTRLIGSQVEQIPANWTMRNEAIPPRVDILDEGINGIQGFGTFSVVPTGESLDLAFRFQLPVGVLSQDQYGNWVYSLKIEKQPGTLADPFVLRVVLPGNVQVIDLPDNATQTGNVLEFRSILSQDKFIRIVFRP